MSGHDTGNRLKSRENWPNSALGGSSDASRLASEPTIAATRSCAVSSVESFTKAGLCAIFLLTEGSEDGVMIKGNA